MPDTDPRQLALAHEAYYGSSGFDGRHGAEIILSRLFTVALVVLVIGSSSASRAQDARREATYLFSPATNLERSELEMLKAAHQTIDIAMYRFTDRELARNWHNLPATE